MQSRPDLLSTRNWTERRVLRSQHCLPVCVVVNWAQIDWVVSRQMSSLDYTNSRRACDLSLPSVPSDLAKVYGKNGNYCIIQSVYSLGRKCWLEVGLDICHKTCNRGKPDVDGSVASILWFVGARLCAPVCLHTGVPTIETLAYPDPFLDRQDCPVFGTTSRKLMSLELAFTSFRSLVTHRTASLHLQFLLLPRAIQPRRETKAQALGDCRKGGLLLGSAGLSTGRHLNWAEGVSIKTSEEGNWALGGKETAQHGQSARGGWTGYPVLSVARGRDKEVMCLPSSRLMGKMWEFRHDRKAFLHSSLVSITMNEINSAIVGPICAKNGGSEHASFPS
ncbi:unnamed protein product [Protopolystoma xenopodis]|uniref:Uncharacterized protein n=1 Tax=Protopolystoma xenopodis TaxID=117903 RepID=A0A3S5A3E6_9PLAT|nr:unnamed protein product [Protopolystoma xenopodis]